MICATDAVVDAHLRGMVDHVIQHEKTDREAPDSFRMRC